MKKTILLWSMLVGIFTIGNAQIDFPDTNFKQALLDHTNPIIDTDGDGEISIGEALAVEKIDVSEKKISSLEGIQEFANLETLRADKNKLTSVDVSNNINLTTLTIKTNSLNQVDISNNRMLKHLYLSYNNLTEINLSNNINLSGLYLKYNNLTEIDISNNVKLSVLRIDSNDLSEINVFNNIDLWFLSLNNNNLTEIDISNNISLTNLSLSGNLLNEVFLDNNINLKTLTIGSNNLIEIDLSNNTNLTILDAGFNDLTEIDISNNINLSGLYLRNNNLIEIDISNNNSLIYLYLENNNLTDLDLSNQINLSYLFLNNNNFTTLNASFCSLKSLRLQNNLNLQTVFMTGQPLTYLSEDLRVGLDNCPSLQFICADQEYLNDIYSLLEDANQTDCLLSSDCADPHNRIQGNITFDLDNDGCGDEDDVPFNETLRFNAISLTGGTPIWAYPNEEGQYTLHAADDTYFFAPVLENPNYFTINPPVSFPPVPTPIPLGLASLTTNYCIQPLGDFDDLEVSVFPVSRAQPGFNATYLIRYKNIGTTVQSGSVTLDYQEDVLDYVSSTPTVDSDINGQLTWNFQDLSPMQTVEIPVTLILNTPMDSPALNGGEILNFTATITGAIDETPENNVMELAQTVVNSYDPNDKTCLEGDILDPDDVGGYLHYLIRFENEGSAEARTIRVLDVIDTEKLDIETLMPLEGSHSYSITITNGNEVEFTFSNINLPFDDANNDGYVLFKIKSIDTLVEGDEIVNSAAIYFDFNFPILTEISVVKVEREVVEEPGFSDYFTLSPNPTTGIMNLKVLDESIAITYILLYDIGGNLVGYYPGTTRTMNVSYLFPNSYFMKIHTDKGELTTQFIKL